MKNINLFSNRKKSILWVFMMLTGSFFLILPYGCKEDPISPDDRSNISIRGDSIEDLLELLGIACLPDSIQEECDSFPSIDSMVIMLPDYPGCSFWITYEMYECRSGNNLYYYLGNFEIINHNCAAFTAAFNSAYAAGGATLASFVENFDHDVFLKIKTNLANTLVPAGSYPCDSSYVTFMSYIRVSCFKWCYVQNGQTISSIKVACGSDCCSEVTRACRDEGGTLVLNTFYNTSYPPHCAGPIIFNAGTPPRMCSSESVCGFTCPN
jgi:hypothetical protein